MVEEVGSPKEVALENIDVKSIDLVEPSLGNLQLQNEDVQAIFL